MVIPDIHVLMHMVLCNSAAEHIAFPGCYRGQQQEALAWTIHFSSKKAWKPGSEFSVESWGRNGAIFDASRNPWKRIGRGSRNAEQER
jgi:hypothetical protein